MPDIRILVGDVMERLAGLSDNSVHCCVTSPPYWGLRDYGVVGQLGLEPTIEEFIEKMTAVFEEVRRVLRDDGTLWLNMGDCYAGGGRGGNPEESEHRKQATNTGSVVGQAKEPGKIPPGLKAKDLVGQPWRLAFALQAAGWYLRSEIIWQKPNPMPESVTDRPTKSHEQIFLLSKKPRYFYDSEAVKEECVKGAAGSRFDSGKTGARDGGDRTQEGYRDNARRNLRDVWKIATQSFKEAHFATFPEELPRKCILAGTSEKGCCPECGAPWTRIVEKPKTHDAPRGWDTAPGAHGCEKRRDLGGKGEHTPDDARSSAGARMGRGAGWRDDPTSTPQTTTIGWQPGCECLDIGHAQAIADGKTSAAPCVVLDPFGGAGTTGLVAAKMGRAAILTELNPEYAEMAARRLEGECGLLANVTVDARSPVEV